jgi:hypothetical protein
MNRIALATAATLSLVSDARADSFQVFDGNTPYYIPHAAVFIDQKQVGFTDASGRVKIDLPVGNHVGEIVVNSTRKKMSFTIDNSPQLKKVVAQ